jgi:NTP pyrophosphatase (non-canonical NTP hydrolase)
MPTLEEAKTNVIDLAKKFGWGTKKEHVATKIYYAMIELGEAGDAWKHRGDKKWLKRELNVTSEEELAKHITEEFIDTIFYCLNGIYCLNPNIDVDQEFEKKRKINLQRGRTYIDDNE